MFERGKDGEASAVGERSRIVARNQFVPADWQRAECDAVCSYLTGLDGAAVIVHKPPCLGMRLWGADRHGLAFDEDVAGVIWQRSWGIGEAEPGRDENERDGDRGPAG